MTAAGEFCESPRPTHLRASCVADPHSVARADDRSRNRPLRLCAGAARHARRARLVLFRGRLHEHDQRRRLSGGRVACLTDDSALRAAANGALGNAGRRRLAGAMRRVRQFFRAELCAIAGGRRRGGRVRRRRGAGGHDRADAARTRQLPAQPVLCRAGARHSLIGAGRAVRAAGLWARIVVDRVVGDDAALRRPDPAAVAGAARRRCCDRPRGAGQILHPRRCWSI